MVLEINAARNKSPLDSKLEILDAAGKLVPRVVLQAVRSSYFTFRGHNSTDLNDFRLSDFADMELNQYVYANGEVMRLWMQPRGPDSGFIVYPGYSGDRYTYFGTTAITHALNETCYIVEPHRPGESLISTGLPQYTIYYENDDDPWRKLGAIRGSHLPRRPTAIIWLACRTFADKVVPNINTSLWCVRRTRIFKSNSSTTIARLTPAAGRNSRLWQLEAMSSTAKYSSTSRACRPAYMFRRR